MSGLNGTVCTPEEQYLSNNIQNNYSIYCLTRGQSIGLTLTVESGIISLLAVLLVFLLLARKRYRNVQLIQRPTDIYMLSLFLSDCIQAIGAVLDVRWVNEGKVYTGSYCTAQGAIQQIGEVGVALATLTIAIHTLIVVMWGILKQQLIVAYIVVGCIWVFVILFAVVGVSVHTHGGNYYETPTPYWCWIGDGGRYNAERISGEYFWFWLTLFVSILSYIPLFFWARGNLTVSPDHWWKLRFHSKRVDDAVDPDDRQRRAHSMIAYPAIYCVVIIPLSVVRWISGFGGNGHVPSAATFFAIFLYNLSGAFNALLFLLTRSELFLLGNNSSYLGRAPGTLLTDGKNRPLGLTDTNSTRSRTMLHQRPDIVVTTEEEGWHLPNLEQNSEE